MGIGGPNRSPAEELVLGLEPVEFRWGAKIFFVRGNLCVPPYNSLKLVRSEVLESQCSELRPKNATAHAP